MLLPVRIKEDKTMKKMDLTISKKGFPCLWERGGGMTKTGDATVIAGASGEPKNAETHRA